MLNRLLIKLVEAIFKVKTPPNSDVTGELEQCFIPTQKDTIWHIPIREDKFKLTQGFLNYDPDTYKITQHHPGVDYGTQGDIDIPAHAVCDGEIVDRGEFHKSFGNFVFLYVPIVDRTFVYFHLKDIPPQLGPVKSGDILGIVGQTGLSYGIHLHLECLKGRKTSSDRGRLFTSLDNVKLYAEDADIFIGSMLK